MPPLELESNVSLWLSAVSQYKARVTFCSYSVMEMCTKGLGAQTGVLRVSARPCLLSCQSAQTRGSYLFLNWTPGTLNKDPQDLFKPFVEIELSHMAPWRFVPAPTVLQAPR